jgi:hypothetical protein
MQTSYVNVPETTWKRIERLLNRLEKTGSQKAEWLNAAQFAARAGKTKDQLKSIRIRHPEMIKPKPASKESQAKKEPEMAGRYLYNWTAYEQFYLQ